ncbi:MAG: hypothetical protein EXS31_07470 [Pedosphaera sp.]|nr:hypothetical protein [Pedosphaera sp.]
MKKRLLQILLVLVVLVVAGIIVVALKLDGIIKSGVETVGPKIAKVSIKLDGVSVSALSGKGELKGLVIGNPEGYKTESAIKVGGVSVGVQPSSVFSSKIIINSISVTGPEITFEGGMKDNNLTKILANIEASLGGGGSTEKAPADAGAQKKLQVNDLTITDGKIKIVIPGFGGKSANVPLPNIHLSDLGKDSDGITPADLSKRIVSAVLEGSTKAVTGALKDIGKGAVDAAASAGKAAAGNLEKATKGIGDLFKKK